ncbi:hypothetical protein U9M48_026664 [Paspalum notatum var. saurae]|uniref:Uncharacterized protein n=1 Tax=Paspalum notatum var. saurae TaxID=547442 RepID=A0AAQ3TSX9_PASNO
MAGASNGAAAASSSSAASRGSAPGGCRGGRGCGLALGRLVRKLRRQSSRALCAAAASAGAGARHHHHVSSSSARCPRQYDPLSYARNFDFGTALDGADDAGYCSFASRFVLAAPARQQAQ